MQDRIHEVAGAIASEWAACPVRSMGARRKTENQQSCVGISESGHGLGPIVPFEISAALDLAYLAAMSNQPRTAYARDNLLIERSKVFGQRSCFCQRALG